MNKKLLVSTIALAFGFAAGSVAAATTSTGTWNGNGVFTFNAIGTNGSTATLNTIGNGLAGTATYVNVENNPYSYNVPNTTFDVGATVGAGGSITSGVVRTGSYAPMYGAAGQSIVAYAGTIDGSAALVQHVSTNYAGMQDLGYGQARTAGGNTLQAAGTSYQLAYNVDTGSANNLGVVNVQGTGSASITQNFSGASANGFSLANGGGIYTTANIAASGIGTFQFGGTATNNLQVLGAGNSLPGTTANPASFVGIGTFSGANMTWTNYAITGSK